MSTAPIRFVVPVFGKQISVFTLLAVLGVVAALIQSMILLNYSALNWWLLPIMFVTSSLAFLIVAMLIKVITGKEDHVMLRYFIVIILLNYSVIHWLGQPVFPYLDILALGYGTIIFFGRFGCFKVGCCHGRPHKFGVCYSHNHVQQGFTSYYAGIRLFPIQIVEACGLLLLNVFSITEILSKAPNGSGLSIFITLYGVLRFTLEYFRGDPDRPDFLSLSEAQWTILLLVAGLSLAGQLQIVSVTDWQMILHGILLLAFLATGVARFVRPQLRMNEPSHIKELMKFELSELTQPVKVHTTSFGVNISGCNVSGEFHYTLSANKFKLDSSTIDQLKGILSMRHPRLSSEIRSQRPEVFSVIFRSKSE